MTTTPARFLIPRPEDSDSPNGPAEFNAAMDVADARLRYAGAQGGKAVTAAPQNTSSTSYVELGTPDRVSGIVVPSVNDLIAVSFRALWRIQTAPGALPGDSIVGKVALFLDGADAPAQVKKPQGRAAPAVAECSLAAQNTNLNFDVIETDPNPSGASRSGFTITAGSAAADASFVTTGMLAAAPIWLEAAADTYDVSVRVKATSGWTVELKERVLRVWTKEFPSSGV